MRNITKKTAVFGMVMLMACTLLPLENVKAAEQMEKNETVYVSQLADGSIDLIRVSDTINNVPTSGTVSDVSNLTDIKNTKGNEKFEIGKNGEITWEAAGKSITYEGNTTEALPVGVEYEYVLNGKVIKPEDLAGKSGKLELTISYKNTATFETNLKEKKEKMNTPFMMVSVLILPTDIFSEVEVSQGRISDQDMNKIVTIYGMPGVIDSLKLDKDQKKDIEEDLSDTITISAQVKDFELSSIYTVATTELFKDIKLGDNDNIKDLQEALDGLVEASDSLIEGNEKMTDGIDTFSTEFGKYAEGIDTLDSGAFALSKGTKSLNKGMKSYTTGVNQLASGIGQYVNGNKSFVEGVESYVKGEEALQKGMVDLEKETKGLPEQYSAFHNQLEQYVGSVSSIQSSSNEIANAYENAEFILVGVDANVYLSDLQSTLEGMENLSEDEKNAIVCAAAEAVANAASDSAVEQKAADSQVVNGVGEMIRNQSDEEQVKINRLKAAGNELLAASRDGVKPAIDGTISGIAGVLSGVNSLSQGNETILQGAKQLTESGSALATGATSITEVSKKMKFATNELSKGAQNLAKGTGTIKGATAEVETGLSKLSEGSNALLDGTKSFKEEGTLKMKNQLNDKLIGLVDRVDALSEGAQNYQSFSGIHKNMKGSVNFIFTTEKIVQKKK